jgi:hypothetical protein
MEKRHPKGIRRRRNQPDARVAAVQRRISQGERLADHEIASVFSIEVVSQPRITPEGKAQADSKAQSACGGPSGVRRGYETTSKHLISCHRLRLKNDFMTHKVHPLQLCLECFLLAEDVHQQKAAVRLGLDDVHRFQDKIFLTVGRPIGIRFTHRAKPP